MEHAVPCRQSIQGQYYLGYTCQRRNPWLPQWTWATQVLSQSGIQHTFHFHGYWFEPRQEWFFARGRFDIDLEPFTLEQLGASFVLLGAGMGLALTAFVQEKMFR